EVEATFKTLVETSTVGIYIIHDGKFHYVNQRLAEIFGYTREELINTFSVEAVVAEEDRHIVTKNIEQRLKGIKINVPYEVKGKKKDGELINLEILGSKMEYEGGAVVIGSLLDITDRKKAQEQIIKEKTLSDSIINSIPGSFALIDKARKYLRWNKP